MKKIIFTLLLAVLSLPAFSDSWEINRDHSEILFIVPFLKLSELTGRFNTFTGEMTVAENSRAPSELFVEIKSISIDTGNKMRDGHLRGSEFFASAQWPSITFTSASIKELKVGTYRADGELTIKNIKRRHAVEFTVSDLIKDTWGYNNRMVKFATTIDRKEFGLHWNKTLEGQDFLIGDTIGIRGTFQMQPSQGKTPPSKHMLPDTPYIRTRERFARGELKEAPKSQLPQATPSSELIANPIYPKAETQVKYQKEDRDLNWWVSFCVLGMFGFFGVALSGIYGKKALLNIYQNKYEETGKIGMVSDLAVIALVLIYSWAFWQVGWG